eukprot:TRINITY_DN10389_c0_g1_i1.p1 TRINITY_DN10389_c0_g1~~TRINITY_DN10389_c0_g1_i1.p1  ORF type:complete len:285 (+),score=34.25 TRINITY_DN10389_c0_g1_i1:177-1031(+)
MGKHFMLTPRTTVASSVDLVNWKYLGDALPEKASWGPRDGLYWAPDVSYHDGVYYMYYAAGFLREMCIGVALSVSPEGPFKDIGKPLLCGQGTHVVDPKQIDDPKTGKKYIFWGSDFGPISMQELADDRISFVPGSSPINVIHPNATLPYQSLVEGAWVHYINDTYYLFFSGDNCCGPKAHYAVMIAQSKHIEGPYVTLNETGAPSNVIMQMNSRFIAPGHNSVVQDDGGAYWMLYHAVSETVFPESIRWLMMDKISWREHNGLIWPFFETGSPSSTSVAPFIR